MTGKRIAIWSLLASVVAFAIWYQVAVDNAPPKRMESETASPQEQRAREVVLRTSLKRYEPAIVLTPHEDGGQALNIGFWYQGKDTKEDFQALRRDIEKSGFTICRDIFGRNRLESIQLVVIGCLSGFTNSYGVKTEGTMVVLVCTNETGQRIDWSNVTEDRFVKVLTRHIADELPSAYLWQRRPATLMGLDNILPDHWPVAPYIGPKITPHPPLRATPPD